MKAVVNTLDRVIQNLESMDSLLQILREIGSAHIGRHVNREDYDTLGTALLMSIRQILGDQFTL